MKPNLKAIRRAPITRVSRVAAEIAALLPPTQQYNECRESRKIPLRIYCVSVQPVFSSCIAR
jgi:hypothetical protein